jgi:hypothetical protein
MRKKTNKSSTPQQGLLLLCREAKTNRRWTIIVRTSVIAVLLFFTTLSSSSAFVNNRTNKDVQATYDASGTWGYSTSNTWSNCPDGSYPTETGSMTIMQTGNTFTVYEDGKTSTGTVNGAIYTFTESYPEDGGTATVSNTFTLTSSTSGNGTTNWTWTEGTYSCNGGHELTILKQVETNGGSECDGDVAPLGNRDGIVNVGDALVALRFALGLETPTQVDIQHGDVAPLDAGGQPNPDGQITVGDALVILRKALGLITWTIPSLPSEWNVSTDFGELKFTVNPDGTGVTEITYIFSSWTCGSATMSGTVKFSKSSGWPITDRQFTIKNTFDPPPIGSGSQVMVITGTFDETGAHASGTWEADWYGSICSGNWQALP